MSAVLVTGAAGFAGGHLVELLARSSSLTITGWRRPGSALPAYLPPIQWQEIDLLDRPVVGRALARLRPEAVYHCAGAAHVGQSFTGARETLASNVLGTHNLLDGLRSAGLSSRVLIPGSSLVYRQCDRALKEEDAIGPASPYALSKLSQEMLALRGIDEDHQQVLVARSFNHTGPRQAHSYAAPGFARQIALIERGRMSPEIEVGNLDASRDLHDVRDTVRAYREILERGRPGAIYNVCSGQAYKVGDVLQRLVAMSRVPVSVRVDPGRYRPNDNPLLLGDPSRIQREIGWSPSIPLDQTLADLLDYWRKEVE